MHLWPHPWLASNWTDLITTVVVIVMMVIGTLANQVEKKNKQQKTRKSGSMDDHVQARVADPAAPPSMKELATRRREQLRELARQRRERMPHGEQTPPTPRPDNLTVQESQQREQARTAYAQRAEALRRQRLVQQNAPAQPQELNTAADIRRQRDADRARKRQAQLDALRRQYRQRVQGRKPVTRSTPPTSPPITRTKPQAPARSMPFHVSAIQDTSSQQAAPTSARHEHPRGVLGRISLRDAIIIKEVLDKPVGLRMFQPPNI